jgi:hypothetical protein
MAPFNPLLLVVVIAILAVSFEVQGSSFSLNPSCPKLLKKSVFKANEATLAATITKFNTRRAKIPVLPRDINWDASAVAAFINPQTGVGTLPGNFFLLGGGERQIISDPAMGVSNTSFASIVGAGAGVRPFSNPINVAPLATNQVNVSFTLADKKTAGLVNGFGVVFNDVEKEKKSGVQFFDQFGALLLTVWAPHGKSGERSFAGAIFEDTLVASIRILFGDNGATANWQYEGKDFDFVACDDWFFFLSDTEVPTTSFRGPITTKTLAASQIVQNFNTRRSAIILSKPRDIDWDGTSSQTKGGTVQLLNTFFLNGGGFRQIQVNANNEKGFITENGFGVGSGLVPLSPNVTFGPKEGNKLTATFFLADRVTRAAIHGFGAVFTDVEKSNLSGIRYLDKNGTEIGNIRARAGPNATHQFIGMLFNKAVVASVVLELGNNDQLGLVPENPPTGPDFVAVDDWLFFLGTTAL